MSDWSGVPLHGLAERVAAGFAAVLDCSSMPDKVSPTGLPYLTYMGGRFKPEGESVPGYRLYDDPEEASADALLAWDQQLTDVDRSRYRLFWRVTPEWMPAVLENEHEEVIATGHVVRWRCSLEPVRVQDVRVGGMARMEFTAFELDLLAQVLEMFIHSPQQQCPADEAMAEALLERIKAA